MKPDHYTSGWGTPPPHYRPETKPDTPDSPEAWEAEQNLLEGLKADEDDVETDWEGEQGLRRARLGD